MVTWKKVIRYAKVGILAAIGLFFVALLILSIYLAINCMYYIKDNKHIKAQLITMNINYKYNDSGGLGIIGNNASYSFSLGDYRVYLELANYPLFTKYQELYQPLGDCKCMVAIKFKNSEHISGIKLGDKNCAFQMGDDDPRPKSIQIYFGRGNTVIKCEMWGPPGVDITTTKEYNEMLRLLTLIDNSLK